MNAIKSLPVDNTDALFNEEGPGLLSVDVFKIVVSSLFAIFGSIATKAISAETSLPPEYRILCEHVANELRLSPDDYNNNEKSLAETIADAHASVLGLRSIKSDDSDITYISSHAQTAISEAISGLERINALPKPQGTGSILAESFIHGLYGNVFHGYAIGVDADEKQKAINTEIQAVTAALDKADALQMILPTIAKKYAATPTDNDGRIFIDISESWGGSEPFDWFCIYNASGNSLDDCTIQVLLTGESGNTRKNIHFIRDWPADTWLYARYSQGKPVLDQADWGKTTVTKIQKAKVSIWFPTYSSNIDYRYQGAEKDKDIAKLCKNLKFSGSYQPYVPGLIFDTQPGVKYKLDGISQIPKCRVDVKFRDSSNSKSWVWEFDNWKQGELKTLSVTKDDLNFIPEYIDMDVSFPDTSYRYAATLTVRPISLQRP